MNTTAKPIQNPEHNRLAEVIHIHKLADIIQIISQPTSKHYLNGKRMGIIYFSALDFLFKPSGE